MKVTVGICTWNRADLLNNTLSRMLSLYVPIGVQWELLVVNNNCTDDTDNVLSRYANRLPLRKLFEATPGKSNALNCAVRAARGDLIIWTDDDVLVDPQWLAAYVAAAERWPSTAFFGGPIEPWFEGTPPKWLLQVFPRVADAFAVLDYGQDQCLLTRKKLPYGANMAVRASVQQHYLYDSKVGPRGLELNPYGLHKKIGEETRLLRQMTNDGLDGRWVPDAKVQHFIPQIRQTIGYLQLYYRECGRYSAAQTDQEAVFRLFGKPRWEWRVAIKNELLFWQKRFFSQPESWIENLIRANTCWGILFSKKMDKLVR